MQVTKIIIERSLQFFYSTQFCPRKSYNCARV